MRRAVIAVLVVAAPGCDERRAPRRAAIARCQAAVQAAHAGGDASPAALVCDELYSQPRCRAAWRGFGAAASADERERAAERIVVACRDACVVLSGGTVPRGCAKPEDVFGISQAPGKIIAIDQELLRLEGVPAPIADELAPRLLAMRFPEHAAPDPAPPPEPQTITIVITAAELRVDGVVIDPSRVREAVTAAQGRTHATRAHLRVAKDLPYARVVEIMDAVRAAGVDEIAFDADPSP